MVAPVRFPAGVQNVRYPGTGGNAPFTGASNYHPLYKYVELDPFRLCHNSTDFTEGFDTTNVWTLTSASTGTGAIDATVQGGVVKLTTAATLNDTEEIQMKVPGQLFAAGYQQWFSTSLQVSDATASVIVAGMQNINTTPESPTEGFYFIKPAAAATVNFTTKSTAGGTVTASAIATLANATQVILSFYYDGGTTVYYFVNNIMLGNVQITGNPVAMFAPVIYLKAGAAAAKTLSVDYILANGELNR